MKNLTNFSINTESLVSDNILSSFQKARVKSHTRKTKSGKLVNVKEYTDKRQKKKGGQDSSGQHKFRTVREDREAYNQYAIAKDDNEKKVKMKLNTLIERLKFFEYEDYVSIPKTLRRTLNNYKKDDPETFKRLVSKKNQDYLNKNSQEYSELLRKRSLRK